MKQNIWSAAVIGLCAILTAAVLGGAYKHKYRSQNRIVVTGLGERQFTSDLIVWKGWIVEQAPAIESGYAALEANKRKVQEYLRSRGIADSAVLFMFVNVNRQTEPVYQDGRYVGDRFTGYELRQEFRIESTDVEAVESVSREISSLIAQGVRMDAEQPEYFYTKLSDLKLEPDRRGDGRRACPGRDHRPQRLVVARPARERPHGRIPDYRSQLERGAVGRRQL